MCLLFIVILNKKKCTLCRPRGYKFENLNSFSVPYFPADATHCPRRFWLDFALFRKKLEWKYWSLGCCVQVVVYILISTKNRLQESRIEKYAGNWCFECTIESSKLMIIFCVAAARLVRIWNFKTTRQFTSHSSSILQSTDHACLFLFEKRPELKNWYLGWFGRLEFDTLRYHPRIVSTLSRHYHFIHRRIVPAGSGLLFSSKSNRIKKLINGMIRTGWDLIHSCFI